MNIGTIIGFIAAAFCLVLTGATLLAKGGALPWLLFAFGMVLMAADAMFGGLILSASSGEEMLTWLRLRLGALAFVHGVWLTLSLCYARGNYRELS